MAPGALLKLDDYRQVAPRGTVDFLMRIGERLRGKRLVHVSASRYGALAEGLNRVVAILNDLGVADATPPAQAASPTPAPN